VVKRVKNGMRPGHTGKKVARKGAALGMLIRHEGKNGRSEKEDIGTFESWCREKKSTTFDSKKKNFAAKEGASAINKKLPGRKKRGRTLIWGLVDSKSLQRFISQDKY